MMYANKLAVAIKVNGKVLREMKSEGSEFDDTVRIPYGSEYSIFIRNLNSLRAIVRIEIDGTDTTDGRGIIVPASSSIEIERFIKNGNLSEGLKFKFIERTAKIEEGPRGIKVEDGLVRIQFEFEREPARIVPAPVISPWPTNNHDKYWLYKNLSSISDGCSLQSNATWASNASASAASAVHDAFASATDAAPRGILRSARSVEHSAPTKSAKKSVPTENDKGITVGGSVSSQAFTQGEWFPTDGVKHVMVFKVLGETSAGRVQKPITVKTKQECPTCGTKSKVGSRFCKECGTGLTDL